MHAVMHEQSYFYALRQKQTWRKCGDCLKDSELDWRSQNSGQGKNKEPTQAREISDQLNGDVRYLGPVSR